MSAQSVLFDLPGPKARRRYRIIGIVGGLVILGLLALIIYGLRAQLGWDMWKPFTEAITWTAYIIPGILATLKAALISVVLATIIGFLLGIARLSHIGWLRWISTLFIEFFRSVPVLVMMIFGYALFSGIGVQGTNLSLFSVVLGLTLYNSCVMAELIRAGVHSLPRGQREAGLAIGLTRQQTLTSILLPQAVAAMLPSLLSQLVVILKDTALGSLVTYPELLNQLGNLASLDSNLIAAYIVGAVLYIVMNYGLTRTAGYLESRLRRRRAGAVEPVQVELIPDPDINDDMYTDTHRFESADERDHRVRPLD